MKTLNFKKLTSLGFINKAHGFQGEVSIALNEELNISPDQLKSSFLFVVLDGLPVPFFVETVRIKSGGLLVKFETIKDESEAKKLGGKEILAENIKQDLNEESEPAWFDLEGFSVTDKTYGDLGLIKEVQEYPMQFLARCEVNGQEILFPLHEEIILEIDDEKKSILIELPEGLLDIYLKN
ncbi:MAG: 16S rRNA processing protein RimM [Bacteroidia bacterium]|nr:16S rRNA processing protein RimM [Bacteroidia bacterium]